MSLLLIEPPEMEKHVKSRRQHHIKKVVIDVNGRIEICERFQKLVFQYLPNQNGPSYFNASYYNNDTDTILISSSSNSKHRRKTYTVKSNDGLTYIKAINNSIVNVDRSALSADYQIKLSARHNASISMQSGICYQNVSVVTKDSAAVKDVSARTLIATARGDSCVSNVFIAAQAVLYTYDNAYIMGKRQNDAMISQYVTESSAINISFPFSEYESNDFSSVYSALFEQVLPPMAQTQQPQPISFTERTFIQQSFDLQPNPKRPPNNIQVPKSKKRKARPLKKQKTASSSSTATTSEVCGCSICVDVFPDAIFLPCKHAVMCTACAKDYIKNHNYAICSVCREKIEDVITPIFNTCRK